MATPEIDRILQKLVRDVELAVHALYRGEVRQDSGMARTGHLLDAAKSALGAAIARATPPEGARGVTPTGPSPVAPAPPLPAAPGGQVSAPTIGGRNAAVPAASAPRVTVSTPTDAGVVPGWSTDDRDAVMKCVQAWLPLGGPSSNAPDVKCIAGGKMLVPTWGERERAREAIRKITRL